MSISLASYIDIAVDSDSMIGPWMTSICTFAASNHSGFFT